MKWISVEDRLPDEDVDCLLWWGNYPFEVGHWTGKGWQSAVGGMAEFDSPPTHYMRLPDAPDKHSCDAA